MNAKGVQPTAQASGQGAAETLIPKSIPMLDDLSELYEADELEAQAKRWARIEAGFFTRFPERKLQTPFFFSVPGRTELCGNHTDHNGGMVLAGAVNLDLVAAALPRVDCIVRIYSEGFGGFELDIGELYPRPEEKASSQALVRGMAEGLSQSAGKASTAREGILGGADEGERSLALRGFDAYIDSRVPPGSGLSSSAAFEVLIGSIFAIFAGIEISPARLAAIGQNAENRHFGKPSGLMDQTACALGSLVLIDFADPGQASIKLMGFDPGEFGFSLAILGTGESHASLNENYASIPREMGTVAAFLGKDRLCGTTKAELLSRATEIRCACGDRAFLRAWHFAGETLRPLAMAKAIQAKDMGTYLAIVQASGDSSYKYLQNIYPEPRSLPAAMDGGAARGQGAGQTLACALALTEDFLSGEGACRVHGGGFAGTIQAYVPSNRKEAYRNLVERHFGAHSLYWIKTRRHGAVCIEHPSRSNR
ncbi:MAG: galactokinase family protein [Spirochaetia bacterium]|nr:galactokinase family protein [Spirochaetia bacterium]